MDSVALSTSLHGLIWLEQQLDTSSACPQVYSSSSSSAFGVVLVLKLSVTLQALELAGWVVRVRNLIEMSTRYLRCNCRGRQAVVHPRPVVSSASGRGAGSHSQAARWAAPRPEFSVRASGSFSRYVIDCLFRDMSRLPDTALE